jgi:hypothetical protein
MLKWLTYGDTLKNSEAENQLLSYNWHTHSGYVNLEKIKQSMISIKYFIDTQKNFEYYFTDSEFNHMINKESLTKSVRLKKNLRNGIPVKYMKEILLKLYNVDVKEMKENYKIRFISIFKNRDPKNVGEHVPYLSYYDTFEENLPKHFLNESGVQATKELLWLLYSTVPDIQFCPVLIKLISISLIFLNKEECFNFIKNLIIADYSVQGNDLSKIRFKLRFNYIENKKLVTAFISSFKTITNKTGNEIISHFEKIGFDIEILIEDMFFNFFIDYLNFTFLCKFFALYLYEGSKMLFRIAYAILKLFKEEIIDIPKHEQVLKIIKQKSFEMKDINKFYGLVFSYKLTENNNNYINCKILEIFKPNKLANYYIPSINGESNILTDDEIFNLWNFLPDGFRSKDSKIIFSSEFQGNSLEKVYEICSDPENSCFNCFTVIKTKKSDVFGVIMSLPFDKNRIGFYKPAYIGLFILRPYLKRYDSVINCDRMVFCADDKLVIGQGDNGPALEIDKDLLIGFSYKSEVFESPCLASSVGCDENNFQIDNFEIFILY